MRIVAGKFRGRRVATPTSDRIRPTSDRTRESLSNILAHKIDFAGIGVMDLFAGTGALGIEAMSRGASFVLFVEDSVEGNALLRTNIENFQLQGSSKILKRDATKLDDCDAASLFDLVFLDPPYGKGLGEQAMAALLAGRWLKQGALAILEESASSLPDAVEGFSLLDNRRFGETAIGIFEVRPRL